MKGHHFSLKYFSFFVLFCTLLHLSLITSIRDALFFFFFWKMKQTCVWESKGASVYYTNALPHNTERQKVWGEDRIGNHLSISFCSSRSTWWWIFFCYKLFCYMFKITFCDKKKIINIWGVRKLLFLVIHISEQLTNQFSILHKQDYINISY